MNSYGAMLKSLDVYLEMTSATGQKMYSSHRVWDKETFLQTKTTDYAKEGVQVREVTFEQYHEGRKNAN